MRSSLWAPATRAQWSPEPGDASHRIPTRPPAVRPFPKPLLLSSDAFRLKGTPAGPRASSAPPVPAGRRRSPRRYSRGPWLPPPQAARSVTHLLARLGRRVVAGCGAGCSCHRVGQILGRSIRLGVIHHLRTTHGSRGSGGPRAAAAALRARATGAAAASVAAPAASAAKAGPGRPRAPRGARAREGVAISGGPCAGTCIFSPPVAPAHAYRAARGRSGPPRSAGMTAPGSGGGSGARGSASRSRSSGPGRAALGAAALLCIDTVHAWGSSYPRRARLGEDGGGGRGRDGRGGAGARRLRGSERGWRASSPSVRGGRVVRMGHPAEGRLRIGAKLEALPASQRGTVVEGNGMRAAALPASSAAPTLSVTWPHGRGFPSPRNFCRELQRRGQVCWEVEQSGAKRPGISSCVKYSCKWELTLLQVRTCQECSTVFYKQSPP